jgi:predicted phage terminase large subunit-like protein
MGRRRKTPPPIPAIGAARTRVRLDAQLIEGFVRTFLWKRFDAPKATPNFHKEIWELFCDPHQFVDVAAPRGHAKSSAGTQSCSLAALLFGFRDFELVISATEKQAIDHVQEMRVELTENEALIEAFNIHGLSKDNEAELVCHVGERAFKVVAKGAEQKIRGIKWRNKRPNLVIVDDVEEDEAVLSPERRKKLFDWFIKALLPAGSDDCLFRVFGTILHLDGLLQHLQKDPMWLSRCYRAHAAFDDFSNILWPEKYPESRLRMLRDMATREGNPSSYAQEYLNLPIADTDRFFRPEWFVGIREEDRGRPMTFYSGIDFAISQKERADRTAIVTVGVMDDGRMVFVDCRADQWDSYEIIEQMFDVHKTFNPDLFIAEDGAIQKSIGPFLFTEMIRRNSYLNIVTRTPTADKKKRAQSIQGRMRAGGVLVDKDADWYTDFYNELSTFPRGDHDDRVDAASLIGLELENLTPAKLLEEIEEEDLAFEEFKDSLLQGRCDITGY